MRMLIHALLLSAACAAFAVEPDEVLTDEDLENRARNLSQQLRCLVCQNETIDESNAELARDLRILVRELVAAGMTDDQAIDHIVQRYGEFVLFKPTRDGPNLILYLAGPFIFLSAALLAGAYLGRQSKRLDEQEPGLDEDETKELSTLVGLEAIDDGQLKQP